MHGPKSQIFSVLTLSTLRRYSLEGAASCTSCPAATTTIDNTECLVSTATGLNNLLKSFTNNYLHWGRVLQLPAAVTSLTCGECYNSVTMFKISYWYGQIIGSPQITTLDAGSSGQRIFEVMNSYGQLDFFYFKFTRGQTEDSNGGGAIEVQDATVSFNVCSFVSNQMTSTSTSVGRQVGGGAIMIRSNDGRNALRLNGCSFSGNVAFNGRGNDIYHLSGTVEAGETCASGFISPVPDGEIDIVYQYTTEGGSLTSYVRLSEASEFHFTFCLALTSLVQVHVFPMFGREVCRISWKLDLLTLRTWVRCVRDGQ